MGIMKNFLVFMDIVIVRLVDISYCELFFYVVVVVNLVVLLYKFFLDFYFKEGNQFFCFRAFFRLFGCLRFFYLLEEQIKVLFILDWIIEFLVVEQLLNFVVNSNIYNIVIDRIRYGEVQFYFYRRLVELLINYF